ncbi:MAG: LysR substrate-binding domain-containing protein [Lachnospiraceae bacterium]
MQRWQVRNFPLAEIQNYPFICLGQETQTWKFYQEIFERQGLELRPDTEVATMDQILPLVKNELGLAFAGIHGQGGH